MHQTQKGKQWLFGLKARISVDARMRLTHSVSITAANIHDITETANFLHGKDGFISADSGYRGAHKKIRTLQNYYKNFDRKNGSMQVLVEKESIQVLCILVCVDLYSDCTQKENSDPNNWGQKSPRQITDLVVLCDGQGEMSPTPFKGSIRP